jgi:hypothetical protein
MDLSRANSGLSGLELKDGDRRKCKERRNPRDWKSLDSNNYKVARREKEMMNELNRNLGENG